MSELEFTADLPTVAEDEAEEVENDEKPVNVPKPYKIFGTTSYQRMVEIV